MMKVCVARLWALVAAFLLCAPLVRADAPGSDAGPSAISHTFEYVPPAGSSVAAVSIAGDFNGWSEAATPMARDSNGSYSATVVLPSGIHHYKIICAGHGLADPSADKSLEVDNGFGDVLSGFDTTATASSAKPVPQQFHYVPAAGSAVTTVTVAGDFNGWSTTATPMARGGDGSYSVTVPMSPGVHYYKFLVDGNWTTDPAADKSLESKDGNGNSGVNVGEASGGAASSVKANGGQVKAVAGAAVGHIFRYTAAAGSPAVSVAVVGDFNGWSTTANVMDRAADGTYSATVNLAPGVHYYKLLADGHWMNDPTADKSLDVDDGYGGKNSGVEIDAAADGTGAAPGHPQ